jgi:hypothetical protein
VPGVSQQLAQFSQSNEKECEEQIELLTLSASNLNAVPRARRESVWAMGLLTDNDELFGHSADEDEEAEGSCSSAFGDLESQRGGEGEGEEGADQFGAPRGRRRSSSSAWTRGRRRNHSTATNVSDRSGWRGWESPARFSSPTPSVDGAAGAEGGNGIGSGGGSGGSSRSAAQGLGAYLPSIASALFVAPGSSRVEHEVADTAISPLHTQSSRLGSKSVSSPELSALGNVPGVEMV